MWLCELTAAVLVFVLGLDLLLTEREAGLKGEIKHVIRAILIG